VREPETGGTPTTVPIHFLMYDATGRGGVARSVTMLANQLAQTHEVCIHNLLCHRGEPAYPIDARVEVSWLVDKRRSRARRGRPRHGPRALRRWRRLDAQPSSLEPEPGISAYTDLLLRHWLRTLGPCVLVTTRPMLHLAAARWAPTHVVRIAQDHLNFDARSRNRVVMRMLDEAVPTVDGFVTLTEADGRDYRQRYAGTLIEQIPNASPFRAPTPAPLNEKVVVSAGRLVGRKGFDRLIRAWAPLADEFPEWQLDIHGEGRCRGRLERQIARLGVGANVRLRGYSPDFDDVLGRAAIYAMSSRAEGFPMVLLEAMSHGLPLISFDCPRGPAEIIENGVNGLLVDDGDVAGYQRALRDLMSDSDRRGELGRASYARARAIEIEAVADRWERLLADVLDRRERATVARPRAGAGVSGGRRRPRPDRRAARRPDAARGWDEQRGWQS
jgi:glycosyltransferase involved in cell wall biosynthesis